MGQQIIIQTQIDKKRIIMQSTSSEKLTLQDGRYCIWSTVVDDFIAFNATQEELIEFFLEQAKNDIVRKVKDTCHKLQCNEVPYFQFTMSFAEAVREGQSRHGKDHYEFEEAPDDA